jgi:hypothetical protein
LFGKGGEKDKSLLLIIAAFLMGIALILTGSRASRLISFVAVLGFLVAPRFLSKNNSSKLIENGASQSRFLI